MTVAWHRDTEHGTGPRILRGIGFFNGTVLVNRDYQLLRQHTACIIRASPPRRSLIKDLDPKNRAHSVGLAFSVAEGKGQERFLDVEDRVEVLYKTLTRSPR